MSDDRIRPCGCVVCVCEDEMQCHGCGAKACEAHDRIMNPLKYPSSPHALIREQCSLCTANRPRLCDQHYKQGADELLKHVTAAIQDQQTPGGVKATYEQLLELCNQQRQALTQQAQEIARQHQDFERATAKVMELRQLLATMTAERDEAIRDRDAYKAEMILMAAHQGIDNYQRLLDQLATAQARVKALERAHFAELKEKLRYTGEYRDAKLKIEQLQATLAERAQEVERLTKERIVLKAERDSLREIVNMKNSIADPMGDTVPRSRYDACNRDWLEERSKREEYAKAAKIEIDRLEQQLAAMTAERDLLQHRFDDAIEAIDRMQRSYTPNGADYGR